MLPFFTFFCQGEIWLFTLFSETFQKKKKLGFMRKTICFVSFFCWSFWNRGTLSLTSPRSGTKRKTSVPLFFASANGLRLPLIPKLSSRKNTKLILSHKTLLFLIFYFFIFLTSLLVASSQRLPPSFLSWRKSLSSLVPQVPLRLVQT